MDKKILLAKFVAISAFSKPDTFNAA